MFAAIDDGRGKFLEPLNIRAERGTRERLKSAAQKAGVSQGELVRRAIERCLAELTSDPEGQNDNRDAASFGMMA